MPDDIVTAAMRELRKLQPTRPIQELWAFERQLRDKYGGERYYVCKNRPEPKPERPQRKRG